jgi:hypothetical protein
MALWVLAYIRVEIAHGPRQRRHLLHATIRGRRFDSMLSTSSAGRGGLNR